MFRTLLIISTAIRLNHPDVTEAQAAEYAVALQEQARAHDFDPLTGVAIITHESRFQPGAISGNGEDYGLAQIRARFIGGCKHTDSPVKAPTSACKDEHKRLLDPKYNIQKMAELITRNRKFCKKKVGSAKFARWLASYQGRNNARKKQWCKPGKGTFRVINTRRKLIRQLRKRGLLKR